jgi:TRAP-type C4-dicarboxylate transport system permease small subunit
MQMMMTKRILSTSHYINLAMENMLITLLISVTLVGFISVFFRYLLERPLTWPEELVRLFFIWIVFIGAAVAVRKRLHLRMSLLDNVLRRWINILDLIANLTIIIFGVILTLGGLSFIYSVRFQLSADIRYPLLLNYVPLCIGGFVMILHVACFFVKIEE